MTHNLLDVTQRPGLAYQYAFDWMAVQLHTPAGLVAAIANLDWQQLEIRRRLPGIALPDVANGDAHARREATLDGLAGYSGERWAAVGWVEPMTADRPTFEKLYQCVLPYGRLFVIAHGYLARFLIEQRQANQRAVLRAMQVEAVAGEAGFHLVGRFGLHPPRAIIHHYRGAMAAALGRRDVRDRCQAAMRRDMVVGPSMSSRSALVCLTLERKR